MDYENSIKQWHNWNESHIGVKIAQGKNTVFRFGSNKYRWTSYLMFSDVTRYSLEHGVSIIKCNFVTHLLDNKDFLDDLNGWNGGITCKKFESDLETGCRMITIGHDYCHLWDEERGCDYSFDEISSGIEILRKQALSKFYEQGVINENN